eukprot:3965308-Pyramimonas_sp.AAC.2
MFPAVTTRGASEMHRVSIPRLILRRFFCASVRSAFLAALCTAQDSSCQRSNLGSWFAIGARYGYILSPLLRLARRNTGCPFAE